MLCDTAREHWSDCRYDGNAFAHQKVYHKYLCKCFEQFLSYLDPLDFNIKRFHHDFNLDILGFHFLFVLKLHTLLMHGELLLRHIKIK